MAEITADAEHLQPKHRSSDDALAQCFPPGEASVSHLPRVAPNPFYPKGLPKTRCSPTNPFPTDSTVWTSAGRNGHYVIEHNFPPHFPGLFIELCTGKYQVSWLLFCQTNPEQLQKRKNSLPQGCSKSCASFIPNRTLDNTCYFWPPPPKTNRSHFRTECTPLSAHLVI